MEMVRKMGMEKEMESRGDGERNLTEDRARKINS
jgi:hypothetical protein